MRSYRARGAAVTDLTLEGGRWRLLTTPSLRPSQVTLTHTLPQCPFSAGRGWAEAARAWPPPSPVSGTWGSLSESFSLPFSPVSTPLPMIPAGLDSQTPSPSPDFLALLMFFCVGNVLTVATVL